MTDPGSTPQPADALDDLARALDALASPTRLELLLQLDRPRTSSEIAVTPVAVRRGMAPTRSVSRQGVELHLKKLLATGLVNANVEYRGRRRVQVHTVDRARVAALAAELQRFARDDPAAPAPGSARAHPT